MGGGGGGGLKALVDCPLKNYYFFGFALGIANATSGFRNIPQGKQCSNVQKKAKYNHYYCRHDKGVLQDQKRGLEKLAMVKRRDTRLGNKSIKKQGRIVHRSGLKNEKRKKIEKIF